MEKFKIEFHHLDDDEMLAFYDVVIDDVTYSDVTISRVDGEVFGIEDADVAYAVQEAAQELGLCYFQDSWSATTFVFEDGEVYVSASNSACSGYFVRLSGRPAKGFADEVAQLVRAARENGQTLFEYCVDNYDCDRLCKLLLDNKNTEVDNF